MPLPGMYVDPMIEPFRNMVREVDDKGLTGPDVEAMRTWLGRMEQLAREHDDLAAFSGQLTQEQVFQQFSDAYSRALAQAAREAPADDATLLENTVAAYEQALGGYDDEPELLAATKRIVEIGRSGVSYPAFLRILEEEGLTDALKGAAPATRRALEQDLAHARESWLPRRIERAEAVLEAWDALVAEAPAGQPDPLALQIARTRIEHAFAPRERAYGAIVDRWSAVLDALYDWVDSFCDFAFWDERWRGPGSTDAQVRRNIARTQQCTPARLEMQLRVLHWYFGLHFEALWTHETFLWEYTANRVALSDARLQLVADTKPLCLAGTPDPALIARAEALHAADGDYRPDRMQAPPPGTPLRTPPITPPTRSSG